jgi:hypothetical protein
MTSSPRHADLVKQSLSGLISKDSRYPENVGRNYVRRNNEVPDWQLDDSADT